VLNELDGLDHTGATQVGVPGILGMNFQAVNIAQKFSGCRRRRRLMFPAGSRGLVTSASRTPPVAWELKACRS